LLETEILWQAGERAISALWQVTNVRDFSVQVR